MNYTNEYKTQYNTSFVIFSSPIWFRRQLYTAMNINFVDGLIMFKGIVCKTIISHRKKEGMEQSFSIRAKFLYTIEIKLILI